MRYSYQPGPFKLGLPTLVFAMLFGVPSGLLFAVGLIVEEILLRG